MLQELLRWQDEIPGFTFPESCLKAVELNLINLENWYFMDVKKMQYRRGNLLKRYPHRNLVPFARRDDNDDVACFEVGQGERVFIVHDFSSEGFERRQEFDTFWSWFVSAVKELIGME